MSQRLRHARDAPIVKSIFQRAGSRAVARFGSDIAERLVSLQAIPILHGRVAHRLISRLGVKSAESVEVGRRNHVHRVVANHAPGFIAPQRPDGRRMLVQFADTRAARIEPCRRRDPDAEWSAAAIRPGKCPRWKKSCNFENCSGMVLVVHAAVSPVHVIE